MATPLPPISEPTCSPSVREAYPIVLDLERRFQEHEQSPKGAQQLINIRILGYLLLHGPSVEAKGKVGQEIIDCETEESLIALGLFYYDHFILPFKTARGRTSGPPSRVSPPSFDRRQLLINEMPVEVSQSHAEAQMKALLRDNFRCPVSGFYELSADLPEMLEGITVAETHCAHIFPGSANASIVKGSPTGHRTSSLWAAMERMGYRRLFEELNGPKAHRLENVLTLVADVQYKLNSLYLWFQPIKEDNTYQLTASNPRHIAPYFNTIVTFTTPDPVKLPLPSREYLAIHAACAKVAHLSGAGKYIDRIVRDMEDLQVLSPDGASADALEFALKPFSQAPQICTTALD